MSEDTIEQQFEVESLSQLDIDNTTGSMIIEVGSANAIRVRGTVRGDAGSREHIRVEMTQQGNRVIVETHDYGSRCAVDYRIETPRDCEVRARSASGAIVIRGTEGHVSAHTASGSVRIDDFRGNCTAHTASGSIDIHRLAGTLQAHTASGQVSVRASALEGFDLESASGSYTIESSSAISRGSRCHSASGSLRLMVPADMRATASLRTASGSIACDMPVEWLKTGRGLHECRINGGGPGIDMYSASGSLFITGGVSSSVAQHSQSEARSDSNTATDTPPHVPSDDTPAPTDVLNVLAALEQGDLTVSDALARLEATH